MCILSCISRRDVMPMRGGRSWFLASLSIIIMPRDGSNGWLKSQNRKCVILRSWGICFSAHMSDRQIMSPLNIVPCPSLGFHKVGWQRSGCIDYFGSSRTGCSLLLTAIKVWNTTDQEKAQKWRGKNGNYIFTFSLYIDGLNNRLWQGRCFSALANETGKELLY